MRCSVCLYPNAQDVTRCGDCGSWLEESKHRELWGARYLLGQLTRWEEDGRCPVEVVTRLRADYTETCDALKAALRPKPKRVPKQTVTVGTTASEKQPIPAHVPNVTVCFGTRTPKAPFAWKNFLTEQNIRWILNLGIFIFSVALAV